MLGLAVGIDYALFIASRYRHEINGGLVDWSTTEGEEAAGRAIATAGSAVVFAGLTVVIAMAGLAVVGVPILTEMGLAAALTVGIAVGPAVTLLPVLLGFAGRRIVTARLPGMRTRDPKADDTRRLAARWVALVTRRPVTVLLVAVTGLAVLTVSSAASC